MRPFAQLKSLGIVCPAYGPPRRDAGGMFQFTVKGVRLLIVASWQSDSGWDHVSVSTSRRCPTWGEMDAVKRRFFWPDEVVMQLHPAEADHISIHPFCLHLWRPHKINIPLPPKEFVA